MDKMALTASYNPTTTLNRTLGYILSSFSVCVLANFNIGTLNDLHVHDDLRWKKRKKERQTPECTCACTDRFKIL